MMTRRILSLLGLALAAPASAETVTYTYDAQGRMIQASHAGGRNANVVVSVAFDQADNRTQYTVGGRSIRRIAVTPNAGLRTIEMP